MFAGANGTRLENRLVDCAMRPGNGADNFIAPALKANQSNGGKAVAQLANTAETTSDHELALQLTSILLATDDYIPRNLAQSDLLVRTRAAIKWLRSGTDKASAFRVLNNSLNDAVSLAHKPQLSSFDWTTAEECVRRVAVGLAANGWQSWQSDIDRRAMINSLFAAWDAEPPSVRSFPVSGSLLYSDDALEALKSLGPLPFDAVIRILEHMYDEPGKHDPIGDHTISSR